MLTHYTSNCERHDSNSCSGPGDKKCSEYDPPEAYHVHAQIGNLHESFNWLYEGLVRNTIEALGSDIKEIIDQYGTPPPADNDNIYAMLIGIFVGMAGMGDTIGQTPDETKPTGPKVLGKAGGPLIVIVGALNIISGLAPPKAGADAPQELNWELEKAWTHMFSDMADNLNSTSEHLFKGWVNEENDAKLVDKIKSVTPWAVSPHKNQWIADFFKDGAFLDPTIVSDAVDTWSDNTRTKMVRSSPAPAEKLHGVD